jgi:hypothetical protein
MKRFRREWLLAGLVFASLAAPGSSWAASKFLNIQGKLTDSAGTPLTGTQTVTYRLYTSSFASVGSAIWTESQAVALSSGLFNVKLGSVTTLDSLPFTQAYYLGIQVAGDANELSPRQQLGASAYAQGSLGDFNVGGNLGVSGSVTASSVTTSGNVGIGGGANVTGGIMAGGQGTVVGTMTVQGNALSVGGSTLAVSGGSVGIRTASPATSLDVAGSAQFGGAALKSTFSATPGGSAFALDLSSGAKLSNGGSLELTSGGYLKWPDGTISKTASPASAAVLTATQTFSGLNTFASTAAVGNSSVYSTVLDYSKPLVGGWSIVGLSSFTNAGAVTFTNYVSSYPCNLEVTLNKDGSAGTVNLTFNGDSGSNYQFYASILDSSNYSSSQYGVPGTYIPIVGTSAASVGTTGNGNWASFRIMTKPGNNAGGTMAFGQTYWWYNATVREFGTVNGSWLNSQAPTSLTMTASAGGFTGYASISCLIQAAAF